MTDYKDIIGLDVEAKSDNPTNVITGEIWFNTTTGKLRYKKPDGAAAWSTGGDLNVGRRFHGGSGTQTAALAFGGNWKIYDKESIKTSFPNFLKIINNLKKND